MGNRIYLRALEPEDYKMSFMWRNDPDMQNMIGGHKYYVSSEREKQWVYDAICSNDKTVLAICLTENDKYIGNVMLHEIDWINRSARIPIFIGDKDERGKGYATEARMLMHKFAFEERGLERIWAIVIETNIASLKMHETCGYKRVGLLRNSVFKNGRYYNQVILDVLKEEFYEAYNDWVARLSQKE